MSLENYLKQLISQRHADSLYRSCKTHEGAQQPVLRHNQRNYLAFCSNDYLGLASDPRLQQAFGDSMQHFGIGSGAAHLVAGHTTAHQQLEQALAEFTGRERALLFSTGYMANVGTITALMGRQDAIFADRLNHASLVDGALLSRAQVRRYAHNDMEALERLLTQSKATHKLIVSDGVFSMDGDVAPLPELVALAEKYDAWLMIDDAHGFGVLGEKGQGIEAHFQLPVGSVPILVGTLGKAFGTFGAFVAGSEILIEALIQTARSYIYTTALPPSLAATTCAALKIAQTETWRREQLQNLIQHFRAGAATLNIPLLPSDTPIQGVLLGNAAHALQASQLLAERGLLVTAIRPPTVPQHTARLRITFSALHEISHVDQLLAGLSEVLPLVRKKSR